MSPFKLTRVVVFKNDETLILIILLKLFIEVDKLQLSYFLLQSGPSFNLC